MTRVAECSYNELWDILLNQPQKTVLRVRDLNSPVKS